MLCQAGDGSDGSLNHQAAAGNTLLAAGVSGQHTGCDQYA
jgi:hypothetical protein